MTGSSNETDHWTPALSSRSLEYGETLADALLGVDRLYREESGDDVGLAVLDMSDGRPPEEFEDYSEAADRFAQLESNVSDLPEPDRRLYYRQVCESTSSFIEWRTDGLGFTDQVRQFLHVSPDPPTENDIERIEAAIADELDALGYDDHLPRACSKWKADNSVSASDTPTVLSSLLDEVRDATLDLFDVPPSGVPEMDARGVTDAPFNAMCDYPNRTVVVNTDPDLTRPWLRKLAIHEGFPGHALQFSLRERWYDEGHAPADGLLSVVNTASSTTFEGIADAGTRLLGLDGGEDRIARLIGRYQTAIATLAAYRFHMAGADESEIGSFLTDRALFGDEGWVNNRVKFLTAPERAALMYSYWHGEPSVTTTLEAVPDDRVGEFLTYLYGRLHSVDSLEMFERTTID